MKTLVKIISVCFLIVSLVFAEEKQKEQKPVVNPLKELVEWTFEQNVGLTYMYDLDKKDHLAGARWQFVRSKNHWLMAGLFATEVPSIGFYVGFNMGKLVEKIKGQPMVYLRHLEIGYSVTWDLNSEHIRRDGMYINVIKIEF